VDYVDWLSFTLSFGLVIALLGLTLWGMKRFGRMQLHNQSGQRAIVLIDSMNLGVRQRIVLVEADGQRMLIGVTPQSITGLGHWSKDQAPSFAEALNQHVQDDTNAD
jgi:flagellar biosynthetic protein FliO